MSEPTPTWPGPQLTPQQWRVLGMIQSYIETHGYAPTVREIAQLSGLASQSTALWHVRNLEQLGMLTRDTKIARSIRITEQRS